MESFDELINLLDELAEKYNFSEEDIARIQEVVYNVENGDEIYGDEYVADEVEVEDEQE